MSWSGRFGGGHTGWSQLQLASSVSPLWEYSNEWQWLQRWSSTDAVVLNTAARVAYAATQLGKKYASDQRPDPHPADISQFLERFGPVNRSNEYKFWQIHGVPPRTLSGNLPWNRLIQSAGVSYKSPSCHGESMTCEKKLFFLYIYFPILSSSNVFVLSYRFIITLPQNAARETCTRNMQWNRRRNSHSCWLPNKIWRCVGWGITR